MAAERRNTMLSRFLKAQRAALSPRDVGLPEHGRRRTPGLRREEVAMLAGVSVSWYTSLEQGRDISVSTSILEQLSGALQLSSAQREFLFALVRSEEHTSELQSREKLVCRLLLEKKKKRK